MPAHVRVSGTWQEVDEMHVRVSGTWEEVSQGWVRVSGVWQQFHQATRAITVTVGSYDNAQPPPDDYAAYGYNGIAVGIPTFGSRSPSAIVDGDGNSRTITRLLSDGGTLISAQLYFALSGASIPDSDDTFRALVLGGTTYLRSAAATYTANIGGSTEWRWALAGSPFPTSGTEDVDIYV